MSKIKRMPIRVAIEILTLRRNFLIKSRLENKPFAVHWQAGKEGQALDYVILLLEKIRDHRHKKMGDGVYRLSDDELIDEFLDNEVKKDPTFTLNLKIST